MTTAKELLKQRYYEPIKEQPELFVGIELEYPVVNLSGNATDVSLTKQLLVYLLDNFDFQADKYDSDNNPIQLIDKASGDMILFEVSYNTIEFAFAKAERISEVEERLDTYLGIIQPYLQNHNHELQGWGVNPNWVKMTTDLLNLLVMRCLWIFSSYLKQRRILSFMIIQNMVLSSVGVRYS